MRIYQLLFLYLLFQGFTAFAQNCSNEDYIKLRGVTLRDENDSFNNTDRNYSHGMLLLAESQDIKNSFENGCLPLPVRVHAQLFNFLTPEPSVTSSSLSVKFGQTLYTPRDLDSWNLIKDDRPYAGLLFAGLALHRRHILSDHNLEVLDSRELTVGIIGPLSFAKEFQDIAHDFVGDERVHGWQHQLQNEPALQVAWDKKIKIFRGSGAVIPDFAAEFIPTFGVRFGNIETSANIGIEGRFGWDLPNDFGSLALRPGTESRPSEFTPPNGATAPRFGCHLFTILDFKYVSYAFSVDGNLFGPTHRVTRQPWVSSGAVGISLPTIIKKRFYNLAVMQVYQTSDFKEQDAHHAYRAIALSFEL